MSSWWRCRKATGWQQARVPVAALAGERLLLLEDSHCLRDQRAAWGLAAMWGVIATNRMASPRPGLHTLKATDGGRRFGRDPAASTPAVAEGVAAGTGIELRPLAGAGAWRTLGLAWRTPNAPRVPEYPDVGYPLLSDTRRDALCSWGSPAPTPVHQRFGQEHAAAWRCGQHVVGRCAEPAAEAWSSSGVASAPCAAPYAPSLVPETELAADDDPIWPSARIGVVEALWGEGFLFSRWPRGDDCALRSRLGSLPHRACCRCWGLAVVAPPACIATELGGWVSGYRGECPSRRIGERTDPAGRGWDAAQRCRPGIRPIRHSPQHYYHHAIAISSRCTGAQSGTNPWRRVARAKARRPICAHRDRRGSAARPE